MKIASALLATLVFAAMIGVEGYHDWILKEPWPGFTIQSNNAGIVLVTIWAISIVGVWTTKPWSYPAIVAGPFAALVHSLILQAGTSVWGRFFFAGALLSAFFAYLSHANAYIGIKESAPQPGGTKEASHRAA